jgi:hypothetical protein
VWWTLVFGALTTAGLAVLTCALLVLHALGDGMAAVIAPDADVAAPDTGRYGLAFGVGVIVQLATAWASTRLAARTAIRRWPSVAQCLCTALVAAAFGTCALLLTLGISPVDVVRAR